MVINFNKKDLVSFGNYLLSQERAERVSEDNAHNVTHADYENWMNKQKQKHLFDTFLNLKEEDIPEEKREAFNLIAPTLKKLIHEFQDE